MIKVLLIEDDEACAYAIRGGLELLGVYEVTVAHDGREGLTVFNRFLPDVVVTDIEMPEMDGFELVKQLRVRDESVIVIMESGRTMPKDVIRGYETGVDDYIKKPFVAEELHVHIQAILKRTKRRNDRNINNEDNCVFIGNYKFNLCEDTLELRSNKQNLTKREAGILKILFENRNSIVIRESLLNDFWGSADFFHSRRLDVFVSKLRKYLVHDTSIQIVTVKGKGIMLKV